MDDVVGGAVAALLRTAVLRRAARSDAPRERDYREPASPVTALAADRVSPGASTVNAPPPLDDDRAPARSSPHQLVPEITVMQRAARTPAGRAEP